MRPVLGWRLAEKAESQGQPSSRAMIAESVVRGKEDFLHENFRVDTAPASYVYNLPWFKEQHGFTGQGPWRLGVSGLVYCYRGTPLTVTTSNTDRGGLGLLGASASSARPELVSNPNDGAQHSVASFLNTAAFLATPLDADRPGHAGRGVVTGPSFQCCTGDRLLALRRPFLHDCSSRTAVPDRHAAAQRIA
jgi:hypothetical protein